MHPTFSRLIDHLDDLWSSHRARLVRCAVVVFVLLGGILFIEIRRLLDGVAPDRLPEWFRGVPVNHLHAISWAMTTLLLFELVSLILALSGSVANTLGHQLGLYALILIRDSFLGLSQLPEPIEPLGHLDIIGGMAADAGGAVILFFIAAVYARMQRHSRITADELSQEMFVRIKSAIALGMLVALAGLLGRSVWSSIAGEGAADIFNTFFTMLVFVDILLALVSIGFTEYESVVFRNFGFAFAAVLLRLAIASPVFIRPSLGVAGGLVAIAVTAAYNFARHGRHEPSHMDASASGPAG